MIKINICFINPDFHSGGPENIVGTLPPLGLLCVAGALQNEGYNNISLIDLSKIENSESELKDKIRSNRPDIIFVGGMASTASLPKSYEVISEVKKIDTDIKTVLGGTHSSFMYEDIISNKHVDYIIRGEGEETSIHLMKSIEKNTDLNNINNLVWKNNNDQVVVNDINNNVINLDEYSPAWDIIPDWEVYRAPTNNEITATVQFSRGCNHKCNFCGQWMFWREWHSKSIETFINELRILNKKYNVTFFFWADENPAQDKKIWIGLLNEMANINKENNLHHMLNTRVDHIVRDKEHLNLYKKSGIFAIDLGMESALQQRLDYFNKKTTTDLNIKTLELLRKHNIISIVQMLIGMPDETKETLIENGSIFKEWNPDLAHFYYLTPFPWTEFGKSMKNLVEESNLEKWDYRHPIVKLNNLSKKEIIFITKKLKLEFNFNPEKIADILRIEDKYRKNFLLNCIIQSLKYRSGKIEMSAFQ